MWVFKSRRSVKFRICTVLLQVEIDQWGMGKRRRGVTQV